MRNTYHRCNLKEFWIKNGFLDPKEGVIRLTPPDELTEDYFTHVIVDTGDAGPEPESKTIKGEK